jgi:hypothetical protein
VPYSLGGWNGPDVPTERVKQLVQLVDYLGNRDIKSLITLFDWETTWPASGSKKETEHFQYVPHR